VGPVNDALAVSAHAPPARVPSAVRSAARSSRVLYPWTETRTRRCPCHEMRGTSIRNSS